MKKKKGKKVFPNYKKLRRAILQLMYEEDGFDWLFDKNISLGGITPIEAIENGEIVEVIDTLYRAMHGIPS